jgi:hypothetical protein
MSLLDYKKLQQQPEMLQSLGIQLPNLIGANISLTGETLSITDAIVHIDNFKPNVGWVMYKDNIEITALSPKRSDVIEAEYSNGTDTISIKHVHSTEYVLTRFTVVESNDMQAYSNQKLIIRNDLKAAAKYANYRLWYQQKDHCWQPLAQQFIGFATTQSQDIKG